MCIHKFPRRQEEDEDGLNERSEGLHGTEGNNARGEFLSRKGES